MNTTMNHPAATRGADALHASVRCLCDAVVANVLGQPLEAARQLDAAVAQLAEAGRVAQVYDDAELAGAVTRARGALAGIRAVSR